MRFEREQWHVLRVLGNLALGSSLPLAEGVVVLCCSSADGFFCTPYRAVCCDPSFAALPHRDTHLCKPPIRRGAEERKGPPAIPVGPAARGQAYADGTGTRDKASKGAHVEARILACCGLEEGRTPALSGSTTPCSSARGVLNSCWATTRFAMGAWMLPVHWLSQWRGPRVHNLGRSAGLGSGSPHSSSCL